MSWQPSCAKCGAAIDAGDRFCAECGEPVPSLQPPDTKRAGQTSAPSAAPATPPPLPEATPPRKSLLPIIVAGGVICLGLIVLAAVLINQRRGAIQAAFRPTKDSGAITLTTPGVSESPGTPPAPPLGPASNSAVVSRGPTPGPRGAQLFIHSFQTPNPITNSLFDSSLMSVRNADGECEFTGYTKGVLPAMFGRFLLDDFIIDCDMRVASAPAGSAYGLIFRAADVQAGAINSYYALLLDPNANAVVLACFHQGNWVLNERRALPASLSLRMGMPQVTLEASGSQFRVFVDKQFAAEFSDSTLTEGRIGLCVLDEATVFFDNFRIDMTASR